MHDRATQKRWRFDKSRHANGKDNVKGGDSRGRGVSDDEASDAKRVDTLSRAITEQRGDRLHPLVVELLLARGVDDADAAARFLKPRLTDLSDPTAIPGVRLAAARIGRAIRDRQPIVIYGDYDVDGITASSVLWHVLKQCDAEVSTYVPHRLDEGYGLNVDALRTLAPSARNQDGADKNPTDPNAAARGEGDQSSPLVISVDCGITAVEPARVAKELGIDLIISDHHQFDTADLPDAFAVVHPGLAPAGEVSEDLRRLCGAGVAFKLAWQVAKVHCGIAEGKSEGRRPGLAGRGPGAGGHGAGSAVGSPESEGRCMDAAHPPHAPRSSPRLPKAFQELLVDLLSLVALGTVADVVPLVGENRVLTTFGLGRIKQTRFTGLNALIDAARLRDEKVNAYHVGFVLGPRLNACGRMGHAARAVHLLTDAEEDEARETAVFLTRENDRRRATERTILEEAREAVTAQGYDRDDCRAIVLAQEAWHPGVIGIVASRLVERFCRPVVLLSLDNQGTAHGSARSVAGLSIHHAFTACSHHLKRFGGHDMAAGLTLRADAVDAFRDDLVAHVNARLAPDDLVTDLHIDGEVTPADCTLDLFRQLDLLQPCGRGNPAPLLLLRNVTLERPARRVGQSGRHLSLLLRDGSRRIKAIAFGLGDRACDLPRGVAVDVVFAPKVSTWQGQTRAELHVKDLRSAD